MYFISLECIIVITCINNNTYYQYYTKRLTINCNNERKTKYKYTQIFESTICRNNSFSINAIFAHYITTIMNDEHKFYIKWFNLHVYD